MNKLNKTIAISSIILSTACSNVSHKKFDSLYIEEQKWNVDKILNHTNNEPQVDYRNNTLRPNKNYNFVPKSDNLSINSNTENYKKSIEFIWEKEIINFLWFFWINEDLFTAKVIEIQKSFWIKQDWVIWPETLKNIYLKYYIYNQDKLTPESKNRISIYLDMEKYKYVSWAKSSSFNVFNNNTYFWDDLWVNLPWTYINEQLVNKIPHTISENVNKIIFSNINGKTVLAFYVNWKLELATFATPWENNNKHSSPKIYTTWKLSPDMLHTSSEYPESKNINGIMTQKWGAVMPYAVHIDWWVWIHWSDSKIDWFDHSHWCIRVPLFFQEFIYRKVKSLWYQNVIIDTRNVY